MDRAAEEAGRKRRSRRRIMLWLLLILAAAGSLVSLRIFFADDIEYELIRIERTRRYSMAKAGMPIEGTPDLARLNERLAAHGLSAGAPVFIRIFKRDFELELWMQRDGKFHRFAVYPICRWSGRLGPKTKQGDHQAPEGFYTVDAGALNPNSRWHRSFNLGYPNAFDRAYGRTGSLLMVHGGCSSIGCYAMTNPVIDEIWALITAALNNGQKRFQVQVFPFRMTDANLEGRSKGPLLGFWRNLKVGHDLFESELLPPRVSVCGKKYTFASAGDIIDGSAPIATSCDGNS